MAAKKGVTVVDITSSRMLMAHGFLSRLFNVFERFKTPVDVVTTSEVSVSVTVDDPRRLPDIVIELSGFAEVSCEEHMAIVCVVGDGLQRDPALAARVLTSVGDVPLRMVSQAAGRRNITFVIRERDVPTALEPSARHLLRALSRVGVRGRYSGLIAMPRLLVVGHGRMGGLVESLAAGARLRGRRGRDSRTAADALIAGAGSGGADVAIDFTVADAVPRNLPALAARGINVVIGTTGWHAHEAAMREVAARAGIGVVAAANFSLGMNVFQLVAEEAARRLRPPRRLRRVDSRGPSRSQEGRAVRHRAVAAGTP